MKTSRALFLSLLALSATVWAQRSHTQHPAYTEAQRLVKLAKATNQEGYYEDAVVLAKEAKRNNALVRAWIAVAPLRNLTVNFAQTARTELGLARPGEEPKTGAPTNTSAPWFSNLSQAVAQFELGESRFTNAETLWEGLAYSNALLSAIEAYKITVDSSKSAREQQKEWSKLQATRANTLRLVAEAERQLSNAMADQYLAAGDSNHVSVSANIAAAKDAMTGDRFAQAEEQATQAIQKLNDLRMAATARRTFEKAQVRMEAFLKKNPKPNVDLEVAVRNLSSAKIALDQAKYADSINLSERVLAYLDRAENDQELLAVTVKSNALPAYYKVRLLPQNRDCFWNIAKYSFAYKDPFKWPSIYQANRSLLQDPNNPNLIQPGMRFVLPSLGGETREGEWVPEDALAPR